MPPGCSADRALGQEFGEFVAAFFLLADHEVASRFEADKLGAWDALGRSFTRLVRGELVIFSMGDQGGHADLLEVVVIHICVRNECVEDETSGAHGEQTVYELGDEPGVLTRHGERFRNRGHHADHRCRREGPQRPHDELPLEHAHDGWTTAVGLPGRLPTRIARCFTFLG